MNWFDAAPTSRRATGSRVLRAREAQGARPASFAANGASRGEVGVPGSPGPASADGDVPAARGEHERGNLERDGLVRAAMLSVEDRIEEARSDGYAAGYAAGYAQGVAEARASAEERRVDLVARAAAALEEVAGAVAAGRASALAIAQQDTAELAFELTRTLVGHELALATSPGMDAVRRALDLAPSGVDLFVHLHPDEAAMLPDLETLPEVVRHLQGCRVTVVPDALVERGGCVIEAGACRIDAQIGSAMERVRRVLVDAGSPEELPPLLPGSAAGKAGKAGQAGQVGEAGEAAE
ncbi:MAG: FliH/SctL family protein, partial [Actinomycetota bacterium]|nr:FliH/SctL family protein [Actinomycetota bacterium]